MKKPRMEKCPSCSRTVPVTVETMAGKSKGRTHQRVLLKPHLNAGGVRCFTAHLRYEEVKR